MYWHIKWFSGMLLGCCINDTIIYKRDTTSMDIKTAKSSFPKVYRIA